MLDCDLPNLFHEITGDIREYCSEKYQNNHDVQPSLLYKEHGFVREYEQLELNFGSLAASCTETRSIGSSSHDDVNEAAIPV